MERDNWRFGTACLEQECKGHLDSFESVDRNSSDQMVRHTIFRRPVSLPPLVLRTDNTDVSECMNGTSTTDTTLTPPLIDVTNPCGEMSIHTEEKKKKDKPCVVLPKKWRSINLAEERKNRQQRTSEEKMRRMIDRRDDHVRRQRIEAETQNRHTQMNVEQRLREKGGTVVPIHPQMLHPFDNNDGGSSSTSSSKCKREDVKNKKSKGGKKSKKNQPISLQEFRLQTPIVNEIEIKTYNDAGNDQIPDAAPYSSDVSIFPLLSL